MATISVDQYNDDGTTSRTAGEVLTINGATFTQRTDTRWHATAPASMTGDYSDILPSATLGGKFVIDATSVRWLAYDTGSGNVPAIGTDITQAGVSSSYLLGVYASLTSAPTTVGNAMPASGFIKFRSVNGTFAAGALTGIGASATGEDTTGWIEVVMDQASGTDINIPRLGEFESRGGWFYLDNTDATTAQVLQVPTNGGGATTHCPGVWVETSAGSAATYSLSSNTVTITLSSHGYSVGDDVDIEFTSGGLSGEDTYHVLSVPTTSTFTVAKTASNTSGNCSVTQFEYYPSSAGATTGWGQGHIGSPGLDGVNADVRQKFVKSIGTGQMQFGENATQSATYTTASLAGTYTWVANVVTITSTAHGLRVGEQVYLDFTSGSGTPDGVYTIVTNAANTFTIALTGSGTAGNVTVWARSIVTFAAHGYAIGNKVYLNWSSGGVTTNGVYIVETVPTTSTFTVNTFTNSATGGNVTIEMTIGFIPTAGLRTRVPNIFLRQCATGSRATNAAPHATITTRPEFITSSAGAIDGEYLYGDWYFNLLQAYSIHLNHVASFDSYLIQECATAIDVNDTSLSMYGALDLNALNCASNFAGGVISNCHLVRGNTPNTGDHDIVITSCKDLDLVNVKGGILQFARSTGYSFIITSCNNVSLTRCTSTNSTTISLVTSKDITIRDLNWVERYMGMTNSTTTSYCVTIGAGIVNTIIDGITFGGGVIPDVHPYVGLVSFTATVNTTIRNVGRRDSELSGGAIPLWRMGILFVSGGNNDTVKIQRVYIENMTTRSGILTELNTDTGITMESVSCYQYTTTAGVVTNYTVTPLFLNATHKGIGAALNTVTAQVSVYGTHFMDLFNSDTVGRLIAIMNEPTTATASYGSLSIAALGGFTSAGTLSLQTVNDEYILECPYWILGHTGLSNSTATVTGTNVTYVSGPDYGNHDIFYQIDTGSGWNGSWKDLTGANLSSETISPTGFKFKLRIVCDTAATNNAISFVRIDTTTSLAAQTDNLYSLDLATLTIDNPVLGSSYEVYNLDNSTQLAVGVIASNPQTVSVLASAGHTLRVRLRRSKGILLYQSQTANFGVGNILAGETSGATAVIGADTDNGTSGSLTLENIVGVFVDGEIIVDDEGGSANANGSVGGKYLPFESNAVVSSALAASVYASQVRDTIAV